MEYDIRHRIGILREGRASMVDTLTYVGRRFVNLLVVLWIAGTLNFAIPRLMPGDPIEQAFLALEVRGGPSQDVAALKASYEEKLGLDQPVDRPIRQLLDRRRDARPRRLGRQVPGEGDVRHRAFDPMDARAARDVDDHRVRDRHVAGRVPRLAEIRPDPALPRADSSWCCRRCRTTCWP